MWLSEKPGGAPTVQATALRGIAISHNGDFDEYVLVQYIMNASLKVTYTYTNNKNNRYDLFGSRVSNVLVGRYLTFVLGEANTCIGDSPKV